MNIQTVVVHFDDSIWMPGVRINKKVVLENGKVMKANDKRILFIKSSHGLSITFDDQSQMYKDAEEYNHHTVMISYLHRKDTLNGWETYLNQCKYEKVKKLAEEIGTSGYKRRMYHDKRDIDFYIHVIMREIRKRFYDIIVEEKEKLLQKQKKS